jgi:hypothetical protein
MNVCDLEKSVPFIWNITHNIPLSIYYRVFSLHYTAHLVLFCISKKYMKIYMLRMLAKKNQGYVCEI